MRRKRYNFFLCWLFHLNPSTCGTPTANYWSGLGKLWKLTCFIQAQISTPTHPTNARRPQRTKSSGLAQIWISTNWLFSNPPNTQRLGAWHHSHPRSISYLGFLLWHLWLSYLPHARVNTRTQLTHALTNPCTKRKVLSLTKLKGKIYISFDSPT